MKSEFHIKLEKIESLQAYKDANNAAMDLEDAIGIIGYLYDTNHSGVAMVLRGLKEHSQVLHKALDAYEAENKEIIDAYHAEIEEYFDRVMEGKIVRTNTTGANV